MKKTRIIASLLCIMMIVCALPMMASAAEVPANLGRAIAAVMNANDGTTYASAVPSQDTTDWYAMNEDFTQCSLDSLDTQKFTALEEGITFNSTDGLVFPDDRKLAFVLSPWAKNPGSHATWSPWLPSKYFGFTFQLKEGGLIDWRAGNIWDYLGNTQARLVFAPTGITVYGGTSNYGDASNPKKNLVDYQPGTELNDALVYKNGDGYELYVKKHTDAAFTKVASVEYFASGGNVKRGNYVQGQKASIRNAINFTGTYFDAKDTIDEVLGGPAGSTYALDFDANSSFANTAGREGFVAGTVGSSGVNSDPSNYEFDAEGLTLKDGLSGEKFLSWGPFGSWSPLNSLNPDTGGYERQALYIKAKGDFTLRMKGPKTATRVGINVAVGKDITNDTCKSLENIASVTIQNEWTEYLIVPDAVASGVPDTAVLYVKGDLATGGKWWNTKKITFGTSGNNYCSVKMLLWNVTGHIKSIRTMAIADSVSDAAATPEGADYLYFNEEFDAATEYANKTATKVTYEGGNAVFGGDASGSATLTVKDLAIPAGGYAEFKVQYDGVANYRIHAGDQLFNVSQQSDYASISAGNGFAGTNNTAWRTWRFVKNDTGTYNVYSQTEGDTGWFVHATNGGEANTGDVKIEMVFTAANDGTISKSKLAYLKVYGPAPTSALTLTDGYTATPVADGATLTYPTSLRAIATPEAGKLLVVSYKGDDMVKAQIIKVEDMVNDNIIVNATAEGATKVKVFLWDNFNGLNKIAPAMTFGL